MVGEERVVERGRSGDEGGRKVDERRMVDEERVLKG